MKKEEIHDLLNRLDLQEWCTELYKVPLTWCELYDIRDYIICLEQQVHKQKETIDKVHFIIKGIAYGGNEDYYIKKIKEILKEVSEWAKKDFFKTYFNIVAGFGHKNYRAYITLKELEAINKQVEELGWKNKG